MQRWWPIVCLLIAFTLGVFAARLTNAPIIIKLNMVPIAAAAQPAPAKPRLPITSL